MAAVWLAARRCRRGSSACVHEHDRRGTSRVLVHDRLVQAQRAAGSGRAMIVLLIDDNDDQRSQLANALRERGWDVETARNGRLGLDAAARTQPSIVLT